jgi:hypothetical protein
VKAIGNGIYVLDCHHRLEAYHTAEWKQPLPVVYFGGNLTEGRKGAFRLNIKDTLPVTHEGKFEDAWRPIEDETKRTQATIVEPTSISRRTVATTSFIWKEHGEQLRALAW